MAEAAELGDRLIGAAIGALELQSIYVGRRLGLYERLRSPRSVEELAEAAGIHPRYAARMVGAAGGRRIRSRPTTTGGSSWTTPSSRCWPSRSTRTTSPRWPTWWRRRAGDRSGGRRLPDRRRVPLRRLREGASETARAGYEPAPPSTTTWPPGWRGAEMPIGAARRCGWRNRASDRATGFDAVLGCTTVQRPSTLGFFGPGATVRPVERDGSTGRSICLPLKVLDGRGGSPPSARSTEGTGRCRFDR